MVLNWKRLSVECPLATQVISKESKFVYDPAYHNLLDGTGSPIQYGNIESFFDDQGWFLTLLPQQDNHWNGVITMKDGSFVYNKRESFDNVLSRSHAKSLLATIAIKYFDKAVYDMVEIPNDVLILEMDSVRSDESMKPFVKINVSDLTLEKKAFADMSKFVVLKKDDNFVVLKPFNSFPLQGISYPLSLLHKDVANV